MLTHAVAYRSRCRIALVAALAAAVLRAAPAPAQTIETVAGRGTAGFSGDGARADSAALNSPAGIHGNGARMLWVADAGNHRVRRVTAFFDTIATYAGTGTAGYAGDGAAATAAKLNAPTDVFVDSTGNVFVADTGNHAIRKITTAGVISTVAGTGTAGFSGDGAAATSATLNSPSGLCVTNSGVLYIADRGNHRVRRVSTTGVITTLAGTGTAGFSGDGGRAASAQLNRPSDVFLDTAGTLYIADTDNHRIRAVAPDSTIATVAGSGSAGFSGDGGLAVSARLAFPRSVFVDMAGSLYIADRFNHRVRRVDATGNITTLVGDGAFGFAGDRGAANRARLASPGGIWLYGDHELFISDTGNHRVRRVDDDNLTGLVGATSVGRGREVQIFRAAFTGDGTTAVKGIRLAVSDLTAATGLAPSDFLEFRLYESADSLLSAGDARLGTVAAGDVALGSTFEIQASASPVPAAGQQRHYLVSAVIADGAVEGHAFRVAVPAGGLSTTIGGQGMRVAAANANRVAIDVVATRLLFATQPDGAISGDPLLTQPVVHAVDDSGFVDGGFNDVVTLALGSGAGTLLQTTATAAAGIATFASVTYVAAVDQESFTLVADDQAGGAEGDLAAVTSNSLRANAVNDPPRVVALDFTINEDDSVTVPVTSMVTDPDDSLSSLVITFTGKHTQVTWAGTQLVLRPDPDFFGRDTLIIVAEDPFGGIGTDLSALTIRSVNDAPVLVPLGRRTIAEDETLSVDMTAYARDVETPFASLQWSFAPSANLTTSFALATGQLRAWAPANTAGAYTLRITVFDAEQAAATAVDTIQVVAVNDPPVLVPPSGVAIAQDSLLVLDLKPLTSDADHAVSTLSWSVGAASGLVATVSGGVLSATPVAGFAGLAWVALRALDPAGGIGADTLFATVLAPPNQPPVLAVIPAQSVELGDTLRLDLGPFVADPDHADSVLVWSVSAPPAGSAAVTALTLQVAAAGTAPYDAVLTLGVTDPDGLSTSRAVAVSAVSPSPLLLPLPAALAIDLAGAQLLLDSYVSADVAPATVTWSADAEGELDVVIDPATRAVTIAPRAGSRAGGRVVFRAATARKAGSDTVAVTVMNISPAVALPDLFLDAGEAAQLLLDDFVTDDDDASLLTWSATALDVGLAVSLSQAVRAVTVTAAPTALGARRVAFAATDAQGAAGRDTLVVTVRAIVDTTTTTTVDADTTAVDADTTTVDADTTTVDADTTAVDADTTAVDADTTAVDADTTTAVDADTTTTAVDADTTTVDADTTTVDADTTAVDADTTAVDADTTAVDTPSVNAAPVVDALNAVSVAAGDSLTIALDAIVTDDGPDSALQWTAVAEVGVQARVDAATRLLTVGGIAGFAGTTSLRLTATDALGARSSATLVVMVREPVPARAPGDFDGDGRVDPGDFFRLVDQVGLSRFHPGWDPRYDLNGDGRTNFDDFFLFVDLYERSRLRR